MKHIPSLDSIPNSALRGREPARVLEARAGENPAREPAPVARHVADAVTDVLPVRSLRHAGGRAADAERGDAVVQRLDERRELRQRHARHLDGC